MTHSWRAVDHHYVGGYYGAASEEEMKRELVEDGPLVVSFEPQSMAGETIERLGMVTSLSLEVETMTLQQIMLVSSL